MRTPMRALTRARRPKRFESVIHADSYEGVIKMITFKGVFTLTDLKVYILRTLTRV